MKKVSFGRLNSKIVLSVGLSIGSLIFLYNVAIPKDKLNIKYVQYVKAAKEIGEGIKITDDMLTIDTMPSDKITSNTVTTKEQVLNKYAKSEIYPGEMIIKDRIKNQTTSEFNDDEREVRIYTDLQAYGGVGPGDRADLIYVGNGKGDLKYEGVLVKRVLNDVGNDISQVTENKYNANETKPFIVVVSVSQDMALNIETLQSALKDIHFKFIKYTDKSKKLNNENKVIDYNSILNIRNTTPNQQTQNNNTQSVSNSNNNETK